MVALVEGGAGLVYWIFWEGIFERYRTWTARPGRLELVYGTTTGIVLLAPPHSNL